MGYTSITFLTFSSILIVCCFLFHGINGNELSSSVEASQASNELAHKRPAIWMKTLPVRKLKPLNAYYSGRFGYFQPPSEVDLMDDAINNIEKKFDDYGHMRFGKRGGGEGDGFDDYGHMR